MWKSKYFDIKKVYWKSLIFSKLLCLWPFLLQFRKRANGGFHSISINMKINLITNSRSAQPGSTYSLPSSFLASKSFQPSLISLVWEEHPTNPKTLWDLLCFAWLVSFCVFCLCFALQPWKRGWTRAQPEDTLWSFVTCLLLAWASQPPRPPSQSPAICYISLLLWSNSCFMFWK